MTFKDLIKTTEGAIVLGGLALTVLSPLFSPEIWAAATGIAYVLVNVPALITKIKNWVNSLKSDSSS
jgi:O-antigen/teichoic acid export membrane protein